MKSSSVIRLVVSAQFAVLAMAPAAPSAEAEQACRLITQTVSKKFFADPIMGIRGDATILEIPVRS